MHTKLNSLLFNCSNQLIERGWIVSNSLEDESEVLFFLGAGASVAAGVSDTYGMVKAFKQKIASQWANVKALNKIIEILEKSEIEKGREGKVDIELLLETIDKLEKKEQEVLLKFYKITDYALEGYAEKETLKDEIKEFIKECGVVNTKRIEYLEPLLGFLGEYRPLEVFSVNYDLCIEQLCNQYKKDYTDGFDNKWNPKLFEENRFDIRLYKIHGSVRWYYTDRADYVKLQTKTKGKETRLITGERATSLILYPMRKWEYSGPLLKLLITLKEKLEKAKFVFVVGYSFRDYYIRRIFWDAARKNRNLTVFLISPESNKIYEERLKDYQVPGLPTNFESGFESSGNGAFGFEKVAVPSELSGSIICLPYKLKMFYLYSRKYT